MKQVDMLITKTCYNVAAISGMIALTLGLVAASLLLFFGVSGPGYVALAVGLIGGGIAVTFSGPLRTVTMHKMKTREPGEER